MITGFPRSGTSYFCTLLNKIANFAVLNEPEERFTLFDSDYKNNIIRYYRDFRHRINTGQPIGNKLVEDTVINNTRQAWRPDNIKNEHFVLATKMTLKYLFSLTKLLEESPPIKVVVLVRNPYNNISSWKNSFEGLRTGHARVLRSEAFRHTFFSEEQKKYLGMIDRQQDMSVRRCMLWNLVAQCVLHNKDKVTLIQYEQLTEQPSQIISSTFDLPPKELAGLISKSSQKRSPLNLSSDDVKNIQTMCKENAKQLGYQI
jgi:hypothetical protein